MEERPNPFSLYDFLGYFVPGAIFLFALSFLRHRLPLLEAILRPFPEGHEMGAEASLEYYVPFILFAYLAGHLLSVISSYTVERYSLWRYGYPSKYLLNVPNPGYWRLINDGVQKRHRFILRVLVPALLAPVTVLDLLLGREIYAKALDKLLNKIISDRVAQLVNNKGGYSALNAVSDIESSDQDWYRFAYHYALENAPGHAPKMQNYVALYGFGRNITLLGVIFFWLLLFGSSDFPLNHIYWGIADGFVSFVAFIGFNKFYRRFSLEGFMAFVVVYPENPTGTGNPSKAAE